MPKEQVHCWRCGKAAQVETGYWADLCNIKPNHRYFCKTCNEIHLKEKKELTEQYTQLKIKLMHERALRMMEKSGAFVHDYKESSDAVIEKALAKPSMFMSSAEMIAAMVLITNHVGIKMQHKIGNYTADIYIESLKITLEVDGHLHTSRGVYDSRRDIEIREALGADWEVVRIPTKYVEEKPELLLKAVKLLKADKQKIRKENGGILPPSFSARIRDYYKVAAKIK